ncbi:MAG: thermonuclease family protein [Candidatus Omnitrophica bacterium]|nr:thermonuclease family protein [Candidatus Omnitrophota bacterium]
MAKILILTLFLFVAAPVYAQPQGEYVPQLKFGLGKKLPSASRVLQVYDAQAIEVEGVGDVVLIGVSAVGSANPEMAEDNSREAESYIRKLVAGRKVALEFDEMDSYSGNSDSKGRALAYVYLVDKESQAEWSQAEYERAAVLNKDSGLEEDPLAIKKQKISFCEHEFARATERHDIKVSLNALLIRDGYATVSSDRPFTFREDFKKLERDARTSRRGLWKQ